MLKYPRNITVERINNFMHKGQWEDVNLQSFLEAKTSTTAVHLQKFSVKGLARIPFSEAIKGEFKDASVGTQLSPTWSTHWFKVEIAVPEDFKDQKVYLIFDPDCEAMIWSKEGETLMGITGGNGGDRHVDFDLLQKAKGGEKILLYIEVAANGMFGAGTTTMIGPPNPNRVFNLQKAELVVLNELAQELYWDLEVIHGIATEMSTESQLANDALFTANKIINTIVAGDQSSLVRAKSISAEFFVTRQQTGAFIPHEITAVGNCHIDTAWLWPYGETKRKIARSWSTQCRFIEQNPGYTFAASQMQQFEWLEQLYPPLFDKITTLVKKGSFIPIGGTWVEMDCNIPSGEAFCRQFLYGQRYLKEKFGFYSSVFWLPDTFGYSSQLPQILKSAGLKYFFTQKLSWNNINKFPHTSFYWKGLDGTSVLTHFSPADTYTAQASVKDAVFMVKNNKDKQFSNKSLLLYGNGDGGGGPLKPMLERIKRFGNLADMPAKCTFGNPEVFYQQLEESSRELNTWQGELYFELHRGTYTSHALVKKYNRKCEFLLCEIELLFSQAIAARLLAFEKYPKQELDRLWKLVLLNQFHDVLPGSSIGLVYVDAIEYFEDVVKSGTELRNEVLSVLVNSKSAKNWFFNPSGWTRSNVLVEITGDGAKDCLQKSSDGNGLAIINAMLPLSWTTLSVLKTAPSNPVKVETIDVIPITHLEDSDFVLVDAVGKEFVVDNGLIKLIVDVSGRITHFYDLVNNRDVISKGELANVFKFYEDIPLFWDAWDVEIYHLEKGWDTSMGSVRIEESGPLRVVLRAVHPLSKTSTLDQKIIITANSNQVVFENDIFWEENRKILKIQFPVAVANDNATFETQFGVLQRPTHNNSSWDIAKFEVCAHKFCDLSEFGYGVALLNDCKYGFSVRGNVMSMSILRSPKAPDDKCDMGRHTFKYALQPHKGTFMESDVVQNGYEFNTPVLHVTGDLASSSLTTPLFSVDKHNIVIDAVKKSEDGNSIVVRLYEAMGGRGTVTVKSAFELKAVSTSNVLEEKVEGLAVKFESKEFVVDFTPFQVLTLVCDLK